VQNRPLGCARDRNPFSSASIQVYIMREILVFAVFVPLSSRTRGGRRAAPRRPDSRRLGAMPTLAPRLDGDDPSFATSLLLLLCSDKRGW
jgi:hypothetical protein